MARDEEVHRTNPIVEVYNDGSKTQASHMKVPPGFAVLDCGAAKSLCGAKPVALMAQTCAREGKRVGDERDTAAIDESYHVRGIGNQIVSSFMNHMSVCVFRGFIPFLCTPPLLFSPYIYMMSTLSWFHSFFFAPLLSYSVNVCKLRVDNINQRCISQNTCKTDYTCVPRKCQAKSGPYMQETVVVRNLLWDHEHVPQFHHMMCLIAQDHSAIHNTDTHRTTVVLAR